MGTSEQGYWNGVATVYDQSMRLFGQGLGQMVELTVQDAAGADRALEVAAGTGLVTRGLASQVGALIATDYAAQMVEALRRRVAAEGLKGVTCEIADLYNLPYDPASFDVVVAANVLHLIPDLEAGIDALCAMVRPGGRLIVPTFCHAQSVGSRLLSRVMALTRFPGRRRFTLTTLAAALEARGATVERTRLLPGVLPIGYVQCVIGDKR